MARIENFENGFEDWRKWVVKDLVDLLLPDMSDPDVRQSFVKLALHGCPVLDQIEWTGNAKTFTINLVTKLLDYGMCESGQSAIVTLLKGLKELRGLDKQAAIDEAIFRYSTPTNAGQADERASNPRIPNPAAQRLEHGGDDRAFEPRTGETLAGRYTFQNVLGKGGNGEVWQVQEALPDGKSVRRAIKLLKPEISAKPQRIERFKKEISLAYRLNHPHIIRVLHWGEVGGQFFTGMDYIEGQSLRASLMGKPFSDTETVRQLGQIAEALDYAHKQGIVHRDVKPENVMVMGDQLYLGDFGLAVSPDEDTSLTETGELVGTKKYMAPEQWDNQPISPQTDVYALGLMAYEMLTGVYPYDASSHARLLTQHLREPLPSHLLLTDEVLRILQKATAKRPDERYDRATTFITELTHWRLDSANVETHIRKYLSALRYRIKGDVYEQLFVDLEGEARTITPAVQRQESVYADPYLDGLLNDFVIDLDADHHEPQSDEPTHVPNILERLARCERVVLVGEPGAGKSFILRRLVMQMLTHYQADGRVPVFVPLNAFKGVTSAGREQSFETYIREQMGELSSYYPQLLRSGRLLLICDALNEMPRTGDGRDLLSEVRDTLAKVPLFVVSCRIRDYNRDLDSLKLERLEVRDMDLPAIKTFIGKYLRDDGAAFWERIGGSPDLVSFWQKVQDNKQTERFWQEKEGAPSYTTGVEDRAWDKIWQGARLIPLARNPYLARVICSLHKNHKIPDNRAELYEAFVTDLYEREKAHAAARGQPFTERTVLETFLTDMANRLQSGQSTTLNRLTIAEIESDTLQAALDATLLVLEGEDIRFTHQLLQEYFVARTLALQMERGDDPRPLLGSQWWQLSAWRETAVMLAEFAHDTEKVAQWLGQASPELAVETLQRMTGDQSLSGISDETRQALIKSASDKIGEGNPVGGAAAYRVLGIFNADTRPYIGLLPSGLPDIKWETIPSGEFIYGDDHKDKYPDYAKPADRQILTLPGFQIARYPVTYAQFQAFIDAADGFQNPEWWEGLAANLNHRTTSREQAFKYGNHPRERVGWYDAVAFCRWLSAKMGYEVRLPIEEEWEKAARGEKGQEYPYGNDFDANKGNTDETGIGQTSAVGIFPDGKSSYGVMDMSGNVWEWCLNEYDNPKNIQLGGSERRVLRGGSWDFSQRLARSAYRYYGDPDVRFRSYGFRLVRPPSL